MTKTHRKAALASARERPPAEPEQLMATLGVSRDGIRYRYNGYRYDRLADALAYATLVRSRPAQDDPGGPFTQEVAVAAPPSDAERELMATLAIDFVDGAYRFARFRYDRLADAVSYARIALRRQLGSGGVANDGTPGVSEDDIGTLRARIEKAGTDRDAWRAAGQKEKYLEAYFLLEALEVQLAERLRQGAPKAPGAGRS